MSRLEEPGDRREVLKHALQAIDKLQARLAAVEQRRGEPIAIIGLGCRFPGGADDPESYWRLLRDGVDAISEVPKERWDVESYFDSDPAAPGKTTTRWGGFLREVDRFDPHFFGISPREALRMDPQQRLFLEVAWEALENAGRAPSTLTGSQTGVFVGITTTEYLQLHLKRLDLSEIDAYLTPGNTLNATAGRVSYQLGLHGPSMAVDTACSSSLVAVHLACQSLRSGESDMALAGGVNVILAPETFICFSKWGMMARDGRCKTFDAVADGFVRGEGCGVVVLKRLSDAVASGDRVLALIRGSAVNQDGPSSGLTVPNGLAQQALLRQALANAGVAPAAVSYVEAHGTGTSLGDPIEVEALGSVLAEGRAADQPFAIGSVKTNLGHLESASGVAGLIKTVLALQHREIPPHLHLRQLTPHIPWDRLPITVPTRPTPWLPATGLRIAGVSAFGFSGTNAHVVLEEAAAQQARTSAVERPLHLLTLSAKSEAALKELAARYERLLGESTAPPLADVAFTANVGRSHFAHRAAILADSAGKARERLAALATGRAATGIVTGKRHGSSRPRVAFLFTGQGAQHVGMGRQLYETQPTFRKTLQRCDEILRDRIGDSIVALIHGQSGEASRLDETAYTQPALFALEYALAETWRSWGIEPDAVLGHSVGEYAAACVAGVLSLEDGLALIAERGRLMQSLPPGGAMAAVLANESRVREAIASRSDGLSIAAVNGPANVVVSGRSEALEAALEELAAAGVKSRRLVVSHAFHSPLMEPILDAFERAVGGLALSPPRIPLLSNLTGRPAGADVTRPGHWRAHLREPVRFQTSIETLRERGFEVLLEIGPSPTLLAMAARCLPEGYGALLPSLRKGQPDWQPLLESLATLYTLGASVDWEGFDRDYARQRVALPTYPFQRERYWVRDASGGPERPRSHSQRSPLLGRRLRSAALHDGVFETLVSATSPAFLQDHRVHEKVVFPATAYLEMATAAALELWGPGPVEVMEVGIREPLVLGDSEERAAQIVVKEAGSGDTSFQVFSAPAGDDEPLGGWILHAAGRLRRPAGREPVSAGPLLQEAQARCAQELIVADYYRAFEERGIGFGARFRAIDRLWKGPGEALGRIVPPPSVAAELRQGYRMHPAILDACLQVFGSSWPDDVAPTDTYLPLSFDLCELDAAPGAPIWCYAVLRPATGAGREVLAGDLYLFGEGGEARGWVTGLVVKRASRDVVTRHAPLEDWLYEVAWRPQPLVPGTGVAFHLSPAEIFERARAEAPRLRALHGANAYEALLPEVEELSLAYVREALQDLGWRAEPGERVSAASLAASLRVQQRYRRLLGRLLEMLAEDSALRRAGEEWEVLRRWPAAGDSASRSALLLARFPESRAQLELLERCGRRLAAVLRGETDPLQLLFPAGSLDALEDLYQRAPFARLYNGLIEQSLAGALAGLPAGAALRVLEIGAGTGGTTAAVLPRLPAEGTRYVFSDVSPAFLTKARQKFRDYPFVRYEILDVELEPEPQGFAPESFDVILAANVLHATSDLRRTLRHVQRLLAPGGLLMLLEGTRPQRWVDLTFGLTEGWWRFTDDDLRPAYPLLGPERWLAFLRELGFEAPAAFPCAAEDGPDLGQALIVARGAMPARRLVGGAASGRGSVLIFADRGGVGDLLAQRLEAAGHRCSLVRAGDNFAAQDGHFVVDPMRREDFVRLLGEVRPIDRRAWQAVLHLWPLDATVPEGASATELERALALAGASALHLAQALAASGGTVAGRFWLVTRGAQAVGPEPRPLALAQSPLWGLARVVASEHPELRCTCVDLEPEAVVDFDALLCEISEGEEDQIGFRRGARYVARLVRHAPVAPLPALGSPALAEPQRLETSTPGVLDSLTLRPCPRRAPGPGEVEVRVHATGLNFRDVLNALGMYPGDAGPLGGECSGSVVAVGEAVDGLRIGDEVMAIAPGSFASFVTTSAQLTVHKPEGLGFEAAATIPGAYMTAFHAMHHLARIARGERVLVHAAAGGVGLAAVRLAQRAGAELFVSAGSPEKREFLRSLGVAHATDSRSPGFADDVMRATDGLGVDVVINSLSGEFIPRSFSVLKPGGRFVELGKRDIWDEARVAALGKSIKYFVVDLAAVAEQDPAAIGTLLAELMDCVRRGEIEPLPMRVFPIAEAAQAFRHMAQAKHIGKIVVTHQPVTGPASAFAARGTYLITGGLSGLGLLLAPWLAERGARHLVLMGRQPPRAEALQTIADLETRGVRVLVVQGDASLETDLVSLFARIRAELPPLRGVVHSAGVLDDGALLQLDWKRFETVLAPKVRGGWLLHGLTRDAGLDTFVLFSSASALIGPRGQANHAAANAFLDALVHHRRALGQPALGINWGVWAEVGAAARRNVGERVRSQGIDTIDPAGGLRAFEWALAGSAAQVCVLPARWDVFRRSFGASGVPRFLSELARDTAPAAALQPKATLEPDFRARLAKTPRGQRRSLLAAFVREQSVAVLGLDAAHPVDPAQPLHELGLDSLMAVELRNRLSAGLGLEHALSATLLFDFPTLAGLSDYLARDVLGLEDGRAAPVQGAQHEREVAASELQQISDQEAEEVLLQELSSLKKASDHE